MAHPFWWALRLIHAFEVGRRCPTILKQPGFHRAVGRVHRTIHEKQYGRNPHEPLAPGEATADPNNPGRTQSFLKHFFDELRNQSRGKATDLPHEPPRK
ncbi:hypothetical protein NLU13_8758 [Sarocladium strictum]|uniref:Uncharacterized protein n=1 Tax=Sarocladium strictum TaxID=5046 RepID=A0AA39GEN1_SARSR|nr:hypothetical protein NLU13_8758 [Sarocladium strictum]